MHVSQRTLVADTARAALDLAYDATRTAYTAAWLSCHDHDRASAPMQAVLSVEAARLIGLAGHCAELEHEALERWLDARVAERCASWATLSTHPDAEVVG